MENLEPIGVTRRIGSKGRLTLPQTVQETLDLHEGVIVEFLYNPNDNYVVMRPNNAKITCTLCGQRTHNTYNNRPLCQNCINDIRGEE